MKTVILSILLSCITAINAQWWDQGEKIEGNGNVINKTRNLSEYDQIKVSNSLDVLLVSGTEGNLTVTAESNLIPYITTEIEGGILKLNIKKGYYLKPSKSNKLLITVPFKDINAVTLAGSGDINSEAVIKSNDFTTKISGSGDIKLAVEATNIESFITGSGDIKLKGATENLICKVTGSGGLSAYDLNAKKVEASLTGSGDIEITVIQALKARVIGSGDIDYKGNPEKEDTAVSGSGDITKKG
ncbi:head GIN domain-containing protein [Aquimarina addita]|uniref:Head GIN domain-containing protein n=1 Tax=Aquimarina addita TaxID=870485 RepID=A0ABP7XEX5_9FLAO